MRVSKEILLDGESQADSMSQGLQCTNLQPCHEHVTLLRVDARQQISSSHLISLELQK